MKKIQFSSILKISRIEGPSRAILFDKFSDDHITQFLTQLDGHDKREHDRLQVSDKRNFTVKLICIFAALALVAFFTFTIGTDQPLFERIIFAIITFGIGFSGGYGLGRAKTPI